jgi:hypothetical protein
MTKKPNKSNKITTKNIANSISPMSSFPLNSRNSTSKKINSSPNSPNLKKEQPNSLTVTAVKWTKKNAESEGPPHKSPGTTNAKWTAAVNHTAQKEA